MSFPFFFHIIEIIIRKQNSDLFSVTEPKQLLHSFVTEKAFITYNQTACQRKALRTLKIHQMK